MKNKSLRAAGSALLCLMLITAFSCKSKKNVADQDAEKQRMEQMEAERRARAEREEEERLAREEAERKEREAREARERESRESAQNKLGTYFNAISSASSDASAESSINEALKLFSSTNAPVLVIIYENEQENVTDYDEPTTIQKYLQYLKLTKNKAAMVEEVTYDSSGKISELVLKKRS